MQAATVLFKMACHTMGPLVFADLVFTVRKVVLMWGAQAGLDLLVVDVRIWELLPVSLILAASCALLIEVGHTPFTTCLMIHLACCCTGLLFLNKLCDHVSKLEGVLQLIYGHNHRLVHMCFSLKAHFAVTIHGVIFLAAVNLPFG
jgi:hypothetical protein